MVQEKIEHNQKSRAAALAAMAEESDAEEEESDDDPIPEENNLVAEEASETIRLTEALEHQHARAEGIEGLDITDGHGHAHQYDESHDDRYYEG